MLCLNYKQVGHIGLLNNRLFVYRVLVKPIPRLSCPKCPTCPKLYVFLFYLAKTIVMTIDKEEETPEIKTWEHKKSELLKLLAKRLGKLKRKTQQLELALEESQQWQRFYHEAELLQAYYYRWHYGMAQIEVEDWQRNGELCSIILDEKMPLAEQIKKRFQRSKKLCHAVSKLEKEIERCQADEEAWKRRLEELEAIKEEGAFLHFCHLWSPVKPQAKIEAKESRRLPFRTYYTSAGLSILVGKSASDNDKLTFKIAHGSDWWLHVDGYAGSHVIIKGLKGQIPDTESLQDALLLALVHSQASQKGSAEVVVTQCRYVKPFGKKAPGKVQISQHKQMTAVFDSERLKQLQQRWPS